MLDAMVADFQFEEKNAAGRLYHSSVFARLADMKTGLYLQPWQEIYKMLKDELGM
jgi:hypothetical protein